MDFITKKHYYFDRNKRYLATSLFNSNIMPSKQLYLLNIHTFSADPKHWPISSNHTGTQGEKERSAPLNSHIEMIKKKFISITKTKTRANFSLPISPNEWSVLSEHVINYEGDKRFV